MLINQKGDKIIGNIRKSINYDEISTGEGHYNDTQEKYVYEVDYTDGRTEKLTANIISENTLSQVDSEGHHYQVLTEVTEHKRYDKAITNVNGFIKSIDGNLHRKRTTHVWKLLV